MARENNRLAMKNYRQAETDEQVALVREKHRLAIKNQRQAETDEQAALAREKDRLSKKINVRLKLMSKQHGQGKKTH